MQNLNHDIFNSIQEIEPPVYLKQAVMAQIKLAQTQKRAQQKKFFVFSFVFTALLFVTSSYIFGSQIMGSQFWSMTTLSFTDTPTVLAYWQDYLMSLLETFPVFQVVGMLAPIFVFMVLLKGFAKVQSQIIKFKLV